MPEVCGTSMSVRAARGAALGKWEWEVTVRGSRVPTGRGRWARWRCWGAAPPASFPLTSPTSSTDKCNIYSIEVGLPYSQFRWANHTCYNVEKPMGTSGCDLWCLFGDNEAGVVVLSAWVEAMVPCEAWGHRVRGSWVPLNPKIWGWDPATCVLNRGFYVSEILVSTASETWLRYYL